MSDWVTLGKIFQVQQSGKASLKIWLKKKKKDRERKKAFGRRALQKKRTQQVQRSQGGNRFEGIQGQKWPAWPELSEGE